MRIGFPDVFPARRGVPRIVRLKSRTTPGEGDRRRADGHAHHRSRRALRDAEPRDAEPREDIEHDGTRPVHPNERDD